MTRINTNVSSLNAQKSLARTNVQLQEALTRLSTGLRINVGKDDPAGLIASEVLRSDIISVQRAVTNSQRANQIIATADSALGQASSLLNDIRGLVTEAANSGAMSEDQIAANQLQIDSSLEALNRIAQTTSFQGRRLLDGSLDFVTDSASVATIEDIQIDQANLGSTGAMAVDVDISAAATKATLRGATGDATATATLNFSAGATLAAFAAGGPGIDIHAAALGDAEDGVTLSFSLSATVTAGSEVAIYDVENKTLIVYVDDTSTTSVANIVTAIDNLAEFTAQKVGGTTAAGTFATGADGGDTVTTGIDSLTITAATPGAAFNDVDISVVEQAGLGATPTVNYYSDTKRIVITIDDTVETTLGTLNTQVNALTDFDSTIATTGNSLVGGTSSADNLAVGSTGISGYLKTGFSAATNATATLNFAAGAAFIATDFSDGTAAFDVNATSLGATESNVVVSFVADLSGAGGNETAAYDSDAKTLTIHISSAGTTSVANVVAAIDALSEFDATEVAAGQIDGASANDVAVTKTTGVDSLTITAAIPGADYNNLAISVANQSGLGATPTAVYDSTANTLVITIDDTTSTTLNAIDQAIDALAQFASSANGSGTTRIEGSGSADPTATANTDVTGGNTLLDNLVVEISGSDGTEVFNFQSGASVNQVVQAVNLVSDATGVTASQGAGLLTLTSSRYGSDELAFVNVISEGAAGTFEDALSARRVNGTDVAATVNGITANGDGNTLSINTATLDLSITVTDGSSTNFEFNITGGGALFQIGPDVVSNQQARLGIGSVNTARLGGASGRLYQLGSGQSASLDTDTTTAARIVDEAITKVTSLRGRLGAFQKTTLDTNIRSLNDTVENLIAAESSIRDADFAAETAALTRAQILMQSGISVLAIANSNPQNVLSLLR